MTGWARTAVGELLGGVSQVLGAPFPADDPPAPPIISLGDLSENDRARLTYMGINPDTASLSEINEALGRGAPPPGAPAPQGIDGGAGTHPASNPPDTGMIGAAADAAKRVDAALAKNHSALNDADDQLTDAVLKASSSSAEGKQQLQALQQEIIDEVGKLGPTLDTSAGQQQLADFIQGKTSDILNVLKNASLDSQSQAAVLDGLTARYRALDGEGDDGKSDNGTGTKDDKSDDRDPSDGAEGGASPTGQTAPTATDSGGPATDPALGSDPTLGGLASDPLMSELGALPALGALGGLPGALGSMLPMGGGLGGMGGGLPFGDLGSGLGEAMHDHHEPADLRSDEHAEPLKDPETSGGQKPHGDNAQPAGLSDAGDNDKQGAQNAGTGSAPPPAAAAASGQQPAASTQVALPDNSTRDAATPALAQAARAVLGGEGIDDAFGKAGLPLPPVGAPVTSPLPPSKLEMGDIGQYTDHRVMALGKNDVWVNGQVTPIDQLETGPNFLGWVRAAAVTTPATTGAPPPPPAPGQQG
jgi:Domain of unknown function (DUF4226)